MQRLDGNAVTFGGLTNHCDVCAVGKSQQLAHPRKIKHADITASFHLVNADLMVPFEPAARGGYEYVSKITDQFTKWTAVYLLCTKNLALASLQLFVTSTGVPFGSRIVIWRADKGGEYTGEDFKAYCQETGITQQFAATNAPQQISVLERVGQTLCAMIQCMRANSGLTPLSFEGAHDDRVVHLQSDSALGTKHGDAVQEALRKGRRPLSSQIIGARAFVNINNPNKLGHTSWEGMMCGYSETESNS